ncbi:MAG: ADP-ribosylglycohydrolase family protein [Deltaproteobacteria bacterium]|nr:ADP-ribosylglycohydrolase family protein [Deltaproteobacteria bacterium]
MPDAPGADPDVVRARPRRGGAPRGALVAHHPRRGRVRGREPALRAARGTGARRLPQARAPPCRGGSVHLDRAIRVDRAGGHLSPPASDPRYRDVVYASGPRWCLATRACDAVLAAANLGDDADTTAAVCGQIAGAFHGASAIPQTWLARLAMRDEITALADALAGGAGRTPSSTRASRRNPHRQARFDGPMTHIRDAWRDHGDRPREVGDLLPTLRDRIDQPEQLAPFARLATHVLGEHPAND